MGFTAVYELPVPIWISTEPLGKRIIAGFDGLRFDVVMPGSGGAPPAMDGITMPVHDSKSEPLVWIQRFAAFTPGTNDESTALCRVLLTSDAAGSAQDQLYVLARLLDPWFDAVRTWVETVTGQDLDPNHRVYDAVAHGANLTVLDPAPTSDGPLGLTLTTPRVTPVPADAWQKILAAVAAGKEPPIEEQMSRDSRAAFARGQLRRSVTDAATAAEIVLHRVIGATVKPDDMATRGLRRKLEVLDKQPLGGLVTVAREAGLMLGVDLDDLDELSAVRNDAIHRGEIPTNVRALSVVQAAINLLAGHGSWKRTETLPEYGDEWTELET